MRKIVVGDIGVHKAVWVEKSNRYVLTKTKVAEIATLVFSGKTSMQIAAYGKSVLGMEVEEIRQIETELRQLELPPTEKIVEDNIDIFFFIRNDFECDSKDRYYLLYDSIFRVSYFSSNSEFMVHPKFGFREMEKVQFPDHQVKVFYRDKYIGLEMDGQWIGAWHKDNSHYFSGMLSSLIFEKAQHEINGGLMAYLHAAGISDGGKCLIFAGDSGSGKSTLSAILLANGFEVLADDFLPIEQSAGKACHFPAAISIKKSSIKLLSPLFPALKNAKEYFFPGLNKTVRYLSNPATNSPFQVPVQGLVFVQYLEGADLLLEKMSQEEAFQRLVPDSYIYPSAQNAQSFISWFNSLTCYQLTYSDSKKMVETVKELLQRD